MATGFQPPGVQSFHWLRNAALRSGVYTGVYLSCVLVAWLFIANRVAELESLAGVRNLAGGAAVILLMAIPVLRFRREPVRMFVSGLTAWTLLTLTYIGMEMYFSLLESRMGAFHVFMLGAVSYGFVAVFSWVFSLCAEARHRYVAQEEQGTISASRPPLS